jgi:hypothetical protein
MKTTFAVHQGRVQLVMTPVLDSIKAAREQFRMNKPKAGLSSGRPRLAPVQDVELNSQASSLSSSSIRWLYQLLRADKKGLVSVIQITAKSSRC